MTYGARLPIRPGLAYSMENNQYEIEENGVLYAMQLEETRSLKSHRGSVEEWYSKLDNETKKKVIRKGNFRKEEDDFYPDVT
ncbi:MAG: hypothetical protein ACRDE8_08545 [Ginsengibacter sp.]